MPNTKKCIACSGKGYVPDISIQSERLSKAQKKEIVRLYGIGEGYRSIGRMYNKHPQSIKHIIKNANHE